MRDYADSKKLKEENPHPTDSKDTSLKTETRHVDNLQYESACTILVDGAWKKVDNRHPIAGIGWIAKAKEITIFEGNKRIIASTPIQTEAYALYHGMCETFTKGINQAVFKSDCAELVKVISSQPHPFEIAAIIHDIKTLRAKFNSCEIKKVSRVEVDPAHVLARAARQGKLKT